MAFSAPKEDIANHVQGLLQDPKFDPASYAIQTGDNETAFQARQALKNRSIGEKAAAFGGALTEPDTYTNALAGAGKFVAGLAAAPLHATAQLAATQGAPIARAVGAGDLANTLENEQQTQGAESTLAGQRVEQGLRNTARNVADFAKHHPVIAGALNPLLGIVPQSTPDDTSERAQFEKEIQAARNAQQLAQQRPLETGTVAAAAKVATGQDNLSDVYSPEALQAQGARPVSPFITESMAAAGDPQNLALPFAAEIPGVKTLAGGIVQGAGKVLQAPEAIMAAVPRFGHIGPSAGGLGLAYTAVHNPVLAAKLGSSWGLGKVLGMAGRALDEQGEAFRTGIPSAADVTAQNAATDGESAVGTNIGRQFGNFGNNVVATALGFAPANYVLSGEDPRAFAQSEVGAGTMGGVFGIAGDRGRLEQVAQQRLGQYGQQQFNDNPLWQTHQQVMSKLAPDVQQQINVLRGTLQGGTGTDVLILDGPTFAAKAGQIGGDARGFYLPEGKTIYLNSDAIGKSGPADAAKHETGHAIVDFLKNAGREGDAQGLFGSISSAITPEQMQAMTGDYVQKLANSTPGYKTGSPAEKAAIEQTIAQANPPEKILEENLAEITRNILNGKSIASYALPQPVLERLSDAAARFMENRGWMPAVDQSASLGFKAQMVNEAARRMNAILYETGKKAIGAINKGPTVTQQLLEAQAKLASVPPITPNMPVAKAMALQRQRDAAQKEINDLQGMLSPEATPNQQTGGPAKTAAAGDNLNRYRIAAILRQQGLNQTEAKQWADSAQGSTDEEAVVNALRARANQKYPTPNVQPASSAPSQQVSPVPAVSGASSAVATQEAPKVAAKTEITEATPQRVTGPEEDKRVSALVADVESKAKQAEKRPSTKSAQDRIQRAKINAILDDIGDDPTGLHRVTDQFGNQAIVGTYDPTDPRHRALTDMGGLSTKDGQKVAKIQQDKGNVMYMRYRSALSNAEQAQGLTGEATRENVETGMGKRQEEYSQDPAAERTQGTIQQKAVIPVGTELNSPSGKLTMKFVALDNVLHNLASIFEGMKQIGRANPYGETPDEQLIVHDAQAYAQNHAHGYKGDGSSPMQTFPDSGLPSADPNYTPEPIPPDRFAVLNMAFHNETAGKLAEQQQKLADARTLLAEEVTPSKKADKERSIQRISAAVAKAQEAYALGAENNPWVDHQTGETNQLRSDLKAAGFDTQDRMKTPFETLAPQHILETSDKPIPAQPGDIPSVRPTGFNVDPAELGRKGRPIDKAVASGFLPTEEDTGKPEEGNTPGERLGREAEQAGIPLSMTTLNGLMQQDQQVMDNIRRRIEQKTGKPARFLPSDEAEKPLTPSSLLANIRRANRDPETDKNGLAKSAASVLRGNDETGEGTGVETSRDDQKKALAKWAVENGVAVKSLPRAFGFNSEKNVGGVEHDVWADAPSQQFVKVTKPSFGVFPSVKNGNWTLSASSPLQYLEKLDGLKEFSGVPTTIHGVLLDKGNNPSFITSQPAISGKAMDEPKIEKHMKESGFLKVDDQTGTYYRPSDNFAAFDLHGGNAVESNGTMKAFDGVFIHPAGELKALLETQHAKAMARQPVPPSKPDSSILDIARNAMEVKRRAQERIRERELVGAH